MTRRRDWGGFILLGVGTLTTAAFALVPRTQVAPNLVRVVQQSGTHETLLAVSVVSRTIVWASGERGTFTHTVNGGTTWISGRLPDAEDLDLRNITGVSAQTAYVMTTGPGRATRIYRTDDGGRTWMPKFTNIDPAIRWRCFSFWGPDRGIIVGDAVRSDFLTMFTTDGGWHWDRVSSFAIPEAIMGERTSSASGSCIFAGRGGRAWFATTKSRVFRTVNFGATWKMAYVHLSTTDSTGIGSISFRDRDNGIAVAERASTPSDPLLATTTDGGQTWNSVSSPPPLTTITGSAYVPELTGPTLVVVGPQGAHFTFNGGATWERIDTLSYNSVSFGGRSAGWAVGKNGVITKISF
jgi:photosystem II stability/assembly factor-like uncharacterized protein